MAEPPRPFALHDRPAVLFRWLDVRMISRIISAPPLLLAIVFVYLAPNWHDLWLLAGTVSIVALAASPDRIPGPASLGLVLVGATALGYGLIGDYEMRSVYTILMFLLTLVASSVMKSRLVIAGWVIPAVCFVLARYVGLRSMGYTYQFTVGVTDTLSFWMLGFFVYALAEGQRHIRHLQRLLEDRSRQTENELHRTLEASRDIVAVVTAEGVVLSISPVCKAILGYAPEEMVGRSLNEFIHPNDRQLTIARRAAVASGHGLVRFENRYVHMSGHVVWLEWNSNLDEQDGVIRSVARDITERKRSEALMLESEQRFRALYDCNPDIILVGAKDTGMLTANPAFAAVTGFDPDRLSRLDREARMELLFNGLPEDRERWIRHFAAASQGKMHTTELTVSHRTGGRVMLEATFIPLVIAEQIHGVYVVAKDITLRREAEVAQSRLAAVLEATTDFVTQTAPDGRGFYMNASARNVAGGTTPEWWTMADLFTPESLALMNRVAIPTALRTGSWSGEAVWRGPDGIELPVSQVILAHKGPDGTVEYLSTIARDIGERKRFEAKMAHLAAHDALTGLLNRHGFQEELRKSLTGDESALFYLDLDEFKYVNDSLGHRCGDELLRKIAHLIRGEMRPGDILSRLSGDEFVIMLPATSRKEALTVAERLLERLRVQPVEVSGQAFNITASIGMACYPEHGTNLEELLTHADQAMYQAKAKGRNIVSVYAHDSAYETQVESRMTWERLIRTALESNGLVLFGQPILDLATGQISHYELLLRMKDGNGGLVPPATFLHVAERFGLIHQIDRWVVRQAIQLLARQAMAGLDIFLEVNLSGKALTDPELLALIRRELAETKIEPHRLVFEITETAAIADFDVAQEFINVLKRLGCRFALDDFGVGFSSFDRLKRLPVDYLKLDGSFIKNLPTDEEDRHLVKAMVDVARSLGKKTIAEFVENGEIVTILQRFGVDYAQGYHVGRPRPVTEIWPHIVREEATAE